VAEWECSLVMEASSLLPGSGALYEEREGIRMGEMVLSHCDGETGDCSPGPGFEATTFSTSALGFTVFLCQLFMLGTTSNFPFF
jgi:hypothetical protein